MKAGKKQPKKCTTCQVYIREDMYHCQDCGTCSEYHDHHCGVVLVCVTADNFRFFILFIFYASMMLLGIMIGRATADSAINNWVLREARALGGAVTIIFGVASVVFVAFSLVFVCQSPCYESEDDKDPNEAIIRRLRRKYGSQADDLSRRQLFCLHYFGSAWNPLRWLLPW